MSLPHSLLVSQQPVPPEETPTHFFIRCDRPEHEPFLLRVNRNQDLTLAGYDIAFLPRDATPFETLSIASNVIRTLMHSRMHDAEQEAKVAWAAKVSFLKYQPWLTKATPKQLQETGEMLVPDAAEKDHEKRFISNASLAILTNRYKRVASYPFTMPDDFDISQLTNTPPAAP